MCLALIAEAVTPSGTWDQDGAALNFNQGKNAEFPSLAIYNSTPFVSWVEKDSNTGKNAIFVKYYDADDKIWGSYSGNECFGEDAANSDITMSSTGTPYVCWQKNMIASSEIYVRHYNGTGWEPNGLILNVDAAKNAGSPAIAISIGTPYVCWQEDNGSVNQIYVRYFISSAWQFPTRLNVLASKSANSPAIAVYSGTPYVSWQESNGIYPQIYVKHYNGVSWVQDGGSLNVNSSMNVNSPAIAVYNGTPYVSWQERDLAAEQIYVKHYNGVHWVQDGGSLNVNSSADAQASAIAVSNGTPYVCWQERDESVEQIYVKYFKDNVWKGGVSLNVDSAKDAGLPDIADSNGTPYVCWQESNGLVSQIYVKHFSAYVPSPTPAPEITEIPTTEVTPEVTKTPAVVKLTPAIPAVPFMVHPNVLRTSTGQPVRITLRIDRSQRVIVKIYTRGGKLVKTLVDSVINAKTFETVWEGIDRKGRVVPTGIYLVYIKTDDFSEKRKIVVVR